MTTYKTLFNVCYTKMKMYDLAILDEKDADEIMLDTIRPAVVKFRGCKQNLKDRDNLIQIFNCDLSDETIEILTNYMIIEYLTSNYIVTQTMLKSYLSNSDFHKYDNKDMLGRAIELRNLLTKENKQLMNEYSYTESILFSKSYLLKGK